MPGFTNFLEGKTLDNMFGATSYSVPATLYIALFTTLPADDGTGGTEVTGGSYARVAVTNNTTNFPNATLGNPSTKKNGTTITFPQASANWGTIVGFGIYDASSSGNCLVANSLTGTVYTYTALASTSIFTAPGYSPTNGDTVRLMFDLGGTTPGGFSLETTYYVVSASGNTFKLSATNGGGNITVSSDGSGLVSIVSPKIINNGDTASFSVNALEIDLD